MWNQAEQAAAATRRSEIRDTMAKKTKKKVPRGGQAVSSFLQDHTTWEADTIQNIILADAALLFRADLIVPWMDQDRAAAVMKQPLVHVGPFLTLMAAGLVAGKIHPVVEMPPIA